MLGNKEHHMLIGGSIEILGAGVGHQKQRKIPAANRKVGVVAHGLHPNSRTGGAIEEQLSGQAENQCALQSAENDSFAKRVHATPPDWTRATSLRRSFSQYQAPARNRTPSRIRLV